MDLHNQDNMMYQNITNVRSKRVNMLLAWEIIFPGVYFNSTTHVRHMLR